ncbi:MAG: YbaK/EbsC family protein [Acidimicrobiales bacterium]
MTDSVIAQLESLNLAYEIVACDPELADTAQFCEAYGYAEEDSANAIVVAGKADPTVFVMCLVLANTRLDVNKAVRKKLGVRKCSFASADQTKELTGMEIGGVTPFGSTSPLDLWIDSRIMDRGQVIIGGGSRDRKLLVPPATLAGHPGAEVVEDLALEIPTDAKAETP